MSNRRAQMSVRRCWRGLLIGPMKRPPIQRSLPMRVLAPVLAFALALLPSAAVPALPIGTQAPDFTTSGHYIC